MRYRFGRAARSVPDTTETPLVLPPSRSCRLTPTRQVFPLPLDTWTLGAARLRQRISARSVGAPGDPHFNRSHAFDTSAKRACRRDAIVCALWQMTVVTKSVGEVQGLCELACGFRSW